MKLSMNINYSGDFHADVQKVVDLEKAGLDVVWVPEAYSFDAVSQMGYLAAKTDTIEIGSGILNVFSRTATCMAQTAAGLDFVSNGRFILGLGASGPQVIEGFHGVPYEKPMPRIRDYINVCRMTWKREKVVYDGPTVTVPLPEGQGTGLGKALKIINHPVREHIPIFWASLMGQSVKATAQLADGWLPIFFDPEKFHTVWGDDLKAGQAERDPELGPLQISAGGMVAIGDELTGDAQTRILDYSPSERRRCTSVAWAPATRTSTTRSARSTATSTRRSRSRTCTSTARRRRRRRPSRPRCSRRRTSSARPATSRSASPPTRKPVSHILSVNAVGKDPVATIERTPQPALSWVVASVPGTDATTRLDHAAQPPEAECPGDREQQERGERPLPGEFLDDLDLVAERLAERALDVGVGVGEFVAGLGDVRLAAGRLGDEFEVGGAHRHRHDVTAHRVDDDALSSVPKAIV